MANVKRGDVVSIDHETQYVTMVNKETRETFVAPIMAMTRPEIMSAYAFLFPGSGRLLGHTTEEMREALLFARPIANVEDGDDLAPMPVPMPAPTPDAQDNDIEDNGDAQEFLGRRQDGKLERHPDFELAETAGTYGNPLEQLVRVIARDEAEKVVVPGEIDEDKVREIARQEAAKNAPRITRIELPDQEPREIEGIVHPVMSTVLKMLSRKTNVYLAGPAGTGKSTILEQAAELLGVEFSSISCHSQMTGAALFGYQNMTGEYVPTEFRKRFEHGGVFCIDEIDNGNTAIISALNQALSNSVCAFPDGMIRKNDSFMVGATGNTFGTGPTALHAGRVQLDFASRTRFFGLYVGEDAEIERAMIDSTGLDESSALDWHNVIHDLRRAVETLEMRVPVSMRHAMIGAKALAAGMTRDEALAGTVFFGVPVEQVAKIREESGVK
jgi:cobaltochelatase CobS